MITPEVKDHDISHVRALSVKKVVALRPEPVHVLSKVTGRVRTLPVFPPQSVVSMLQQTTNRVSVSFPLLTDIARHVSVSFSR